MPCRWRARGSTISPSWSAVDKNSHRSWSVAKTWPRRSGQSDLLHQAAIRKEGAPGDVARLVGGEEGDDVRNLLRLARPAQRYFCQRVLGLLWVVKRRHRHWRRDHAGCDVVDPHVLPG